MARKYDSEATRKRILKAAEQEFGKVGFEGARVDRIARKAKANKGMLYIYFGNKEQLYRAVFLEHYRQVNEQQAFLALTEEDLPVLTERILEVYFHFHERHPNWWRFMAWENLNPGRGISPEDLHAISGAVIEHLHALYHAGQAKGIFREDVSFSTYIFSLMAVSFFYRSNLATMRGTLLENMAAETYRHTMIQELSRMVSHGVLNSPTTEKR